MLPLSLLRVYHNPCLFGTIFRGLLNDGGSVMFHYQQKGIGNNLIIYNNNSIPSVLFYKIMEIHSIGQLDKPVTCGC